jgi:hypothetical protein
MIQPPARLSSGSVHLVRQALHGLPLGHPLLFRAAVGFVATPSFFHLHLDTLLPHSRRRNLPCTSQRHITNELVVLYRGPCCTISGLGALAGQWPWLGSTACLDLKLASALRWSLVDTLSTDSSGCPAFCEDQFCHKKAFGSPMQIVTLPSGRSSLPHWFPLRIARLDARRASCLQHGTLGRHKEIRSALSTGRHQWQGASHIRAGINRGSNAAVTTREAAISSNQSMSCNDDLFVERSE